MVGWEPLRLPALRLLWWAAWAEFLLVRLLSRVGIYIPKSGTALAIYQGFLQAGEFAFNLTLLTTAVVVAAEVAARRQWLVGLAAALVLFVPGAAAPAGWSLAAAVAAAAAVAWLAREALRRCEFRLVVALVALVHLLGYAVQAAQLGWTLLALPGALPGAGSLLRLGELLALPAPMLLLSGAVRRRLSAPAWAAGIGAALALAAAYWANADLTAILAMYSLGFSLSWPAVLYLIALGAGLPAMVWLVRADPLRGLALGLLFLAGYTLHVNQQHLLVLAGWAVLASPAASSAAKEVAA